MKMISEKLIQSIEELGKLYDFLNKTFYESALSKPVITIMPEDRKRHGGRILGWFTRYEVWREQSGNKAYELNVTADYADRPLLEIAETLLHEMAHQYARENGIDDCSRSGSYHNKNFADIASAHGLKVMKTEKYGFSYTKLTAEAENAIIGFEFEEPLIYRRQTLDKEEIMDLLDKEVPKDTPDREKVIQDLYDGLQEGKYTIGSNGVKAKKSSTRKYICPQCGMTVRATRKVNIKCGDCDVTMQCDTEQEEKILTA